MEIPRRQNIYLIHFKEWDEEEEETFIILLDTLLYDLDSKKKNVLKYKMSMHSLYHSPAPSFSLKDILG